MNCKLCNQVKDLRKSHIIPEFAFEPLYDEKHRFQFISTEKGKKNKHIQKGIWERLLCDDCENLLSKYERYVSLMLSGDISVSISQEEKLVRVEGVDYAKFKLFALSVLWRAGVSNHPTYEHVQLGPHEERLRAMVIGNNPGPASRYPFILAPIEGHGGALSGLVVQPTRSRIAGHNVYRFVFAGLVWVFVVSSHAPPSVLADASLSEDGSLKLVPTDLNKLKFITEMAKELEAQGKLE